MQTSHPKLQSHDDSEKNVICLLSHIAPSFPKTLLTVSTNIFKSTPKLHSSIYFVSNFTTSSKSVILLLPLTCHNPVSPGLNAILALWCGSYCSHSSTVGGLVPTRLISPFRILKNCGNSSRLVFLINCPIPVLRVPSGSTLFPIILGSKSILNISPSLILF